MCAADAVSFQVWSRWMILLTISVYFGPLIIHEQWWFKQQAIKYSILFTAFKRIESLSSICLIPKQSADLYLTSGFAILSLSYVLHLSLVFDSLDIVCEGYWLTGRKTPSYLPANALREWRWTLETEVFGRILFVCRLFVAVMKWTDKSVSRWIKHWQCR